MSLDLTTMCMSTNKESTKSSHRETRLLRVKMKRRELKRSHLIFSALISIFTNKDMFNEDDEVDY
jgi:hypothetical protein